MNFIYDIQTNLSPFLMELVPSRGGDVKDVNAIKFIHLNVYPCTKLLV
jgi:hypothetical protein